ncbi:MAG: TRAP transporter small permease subunit [Acidiferrobacterales bacterium]
MSSLSKISTSLEILSEWSGRIAAWLVLLLVGVVVYDVLNRVIFRNGSVALQELEWHLFAIIFLVGSAYTLKHNAHVRLELFYQHFSKKTQAWVDLLGTLFFLLPLCLVIISSSLPFIYNAYQFSEGSPDPGGLPYRFLIKAAIPLGFLLLLFQGIAIISQKLQVLMPKYRQAEQKGKLKNDGDPS